MNTIGYFEIQASEPAKAVVFYKEVFGWNFMRDENIPIEYYRMDGPGMMGAILERPTKMPPTEFGTNAFVCSVQVKDFDATAATIMANGGQVALPKFEVQGRCWQGYFIDIDHNTFGIYQPL